MIQFLRTILKDKFFNRHYLLYLSGIVVVVYFLINIITISMLDNNRLAQAPVLQESSSENNELDIDSAVSKAEQYFTFNLDKITVSQRLMLDYLQRRYDIASVLSASNTPVVNDTERGTPYYMEVESLMRIAYPDRKVKNLGLNPSMLAVASNCDHIPVPSSYSTRLLNEVEKGGYEATHVLLALQIMKDLECTAPTNIDLLQYKAYEKLAGIINDPNTINDLRYESIAFLSLSGKRDLVKREWIVRIIEEQLPDGAWPFNQDNKYIGDEHASMLALWALLAYNRPDAPAEPIIRR